LGDGKRSFDRKIEERKMRRKSSRVPHAKDAKNAKRREPRMPWQAATMGRHG
jgi:hypothetical protein